MLKWTRRLILLLGIATTASANCVIDRDCVSTDYCVPQGLLMGTCQPRPTSCTCVNSSYGACSDVSLTCPACCWIPTIGCTTNVVACTAPPPPPASCTMVPAGATCNNITSCCDWSAGLTCDLIANKCVTISVSTATSSGSASGPCGPNTLCGQVTSAENPSVRLKDIAIELHNRRGTFSRSTRTDANGWYMFNASSPSYVVPVENRTWLSIPGWKYTQPGGMENFQMRFVPFTLAVSGRQGTFVLLTSAPVSGLPPPMGVHGVMDVISGVIGFNNEDKLYPLPGRSYWLTCWIYNRQNDSYDNTGSIQLAGTPADAQTTLTQACP